MINGMERKEAIKVEPKFKVGDWIACNRLFNPALIVDIDDDKYEIEFTDNGSKWFHDIDYIDGIFHHWTIEEAKDGDVLSYGTDEENLWILIYESLYKPYEGHVHYHAILANDDFSGKGTCCISIDNLKPATKKQRDFLFQKMKEAGYEFDTYTKLLKKVE